MGNTITVYLTETFIAPIMVLSFDRAGEMIFDSICGNQNKTTVKRECNECKGDGVIKKKCIFYTTTEKCVCQ